MHLLKECKSQTTLRSIASHIFSIEKNKIIM